MYSLVSSALVEVKSTPPHIEKFDAGFRPLRLFMRSWNLASRSLRYRIWWWLLSIKIHIFWWPLSLADARARGIHVVGQTHTVSYSGSMEGLPNLKGRRRPSSPRHSVGEFIETATLMFSKLLVLDVLIVLFSNVVCLALSGIKRQGFEPRWMYSSAVHTIDVCIYFYLLMYADIIVTSVACTNRINSTAHIIRN